MSGTGILNLYGLTHTFQVEKVNAVVNSWTVHIVEGWFSFHLWDFLALLPKFNNMGCVCLGDGLGATKTRLFGKKSGGTPNPQVKKLGGTPNPDHIFASAAAWRGSGWPRR